MSGQQSAVTPMSTPIFDELLREMGAGRPPAPAQPVDVADVDERSRHSSNAAVS